MTWENDVEVEFTHKDREYIASADVVVTLRKADVGPIGYREHVYSWVGEDLDIKNLLIGDKSSAEDLVEIPPDLKEKAEIEITDKAYMKAEEAME